MSIIEVECLYDIGETVEGQKDNWLVSEIQITIDKRRTYIAYWLENLRDSNEGIWVSEQERIIEEIRARRKNCLS